MYVSQAIGNLLEDEFGIGLLKLALPFDESKQISSAGVFHDHEQMLAGLEDFKQPDNVGVLDLLQQVDLLEDLPLTEVVLHVILLDGLYSYLFASELVYAEGHLAEGSLADQLHELVEVQGRRWQLVILLNVLFDVLYQVVAFLQDRIVHLGRWLCRRRVMVG